MTVKDTDEKKHTFIISSRAEITVSGYGGFDEWTVFDLTHEREMVFFDKLQKLIEEFGGEFTGAN